jgi:gamma-glutamyltranspeptidase / glutathione hydrolase
MRPQRPNVRGRRHAASAGHSLAVLAAFQVLEAGGNAVDAGVAAGLVTNIVQPDFAHFGGIAPIIIYDARTHETVSLAGIGWYPARLTAAWLRERHGEIPYGVLRSVVPGAPDAWLAALQLFGTKTFGEVASFAVDLAEQGFPVHEFLAANIRRWRQDFERWETSRPLFLPDGEIPAPGSLFVQPALARLLKGMIDAETRSKRLGREEAIQAARDYFYRGPVARTLAEFSERHGGLLDLQDFGEYRVRLEPPVRIAYKDCAVYTCGPWSQGPVMAQALKLLEPIDLSKLGHNTPTYVHTVVEALKLAFADRERYYGDPEFVDVPMAELVSDRYAALRRPLIRDAAWPELPPPGDPLGGRAEVEMDWRRWFHVSPARASADTSYLCVIDHQGNIFSATPSDAGYDTPLVPDLQISISSRGCQGYLVEGNPNIVAPRKRPRITPSPALALRAGQPFMAFGSPGGDVIPQAMLQTFLNIVEYRMSPQEAVEAPRFASYTPPDSFWPHDYDPGKLKIEAPLAETALSWLLGHGHRAEVVSDDDVYLMGGMCVVLRDAATGVLSTGADPRRECYAAAW